MSIVQQLDQQANALPPINPNISPKQYFLEAATFLKHAGQAKQIGDYQNAYLNLKKYLIIIKDRLDKHPQIRQPEFRDEYFFNVEKCNALLIEVESLQQTISRGSKLPPPPIKRNLPPPPTQQNLPPPPKKGFFSSFFGTSQKNLPPPPKSSVQKNLPPPPPKNLQEKTVETVVMNDKVQTVVGNSVANLAKNEVVQEKVANSVSNLAQNKNVQSKVGNMIAENTDNKMVAMMAKNEKVQATVGTAFAKTIGNKEVQKKVGHSVAKAATNKEVQRKVATGVVTGTKYGAKGAFALGKYLIKGAMKENPKEEESN